jgi:formamidopyrimidine-DNA glycosylase
LRGSFPGRKLEAMPELPDITAYITALEPRVLGQRLERVRLGSVFLLRTAEPPLASVEGRTVGEIRRIGKRIAMRAAWCRPRSGPATP